LHARTRNSAATEIVYIEFTDRFQWNDRKKCSRLFKVTNLGSSQKPICDFLL